MTGVNSIPPGLYSLNGSASGYVDGFFYGPSVDEIGAVWSLGNTDNSGAAYGVVAAGRSGGTAPATTRPQFLVQTLPAPDATTSAPPVIGTPVAAAIDTTSHAPVFASVGGPNLSSTGGNFSAAQTFVPLRLTELQFTSTGMSAANDAANADIVLDTNGGLPGNPGIGSVSLIARKA